MNAIRPNRFRSSWESLGRRLPRPRSVLCISAHWETRGAYVTATEAPETIHDFYGFPKALFDVRYPAPGDPELAERVASLVTSERVRLDPGRGLDHGAWSVLIAMYPDADRLSLFGDHAHVVVSEPLNDLPGVFLEVGESTVAVLDPDGYHHHPFLDA